MRFLPREERFYTLFLDQVQLISEANTLLLNSLKSGNGTLEQAADRITALERKADSVIGEIFQRLGQTFITPIDAEDIHSLATRLDDVIDGIEDLAHRIVAYQIEPIPPIAIEVVTDIGACVQALDSAFHALQNGGDVVASCIEVSRIEEEVDEKIRAAIRDLFRNEKDAICIIKLKEVLDLLEETTDHCDDVSVALQNVIIKNS